MNIELTAKQYIFPDEQQIKSFKEIMNTYTQALNFASGTHGVICVLPQPSICGQGEIPCETQPKIGT